ncbi:MAG: GAF domain-containing protein [Anaerolineae bacterium]|nr:GAF domain-containing protein [Anaerolineae bacterium]
MNKEAEQALQESEQKYRALFTEALSPIFLVDEAGRYVDANQAALGFLECSLDELIGKTVWDFSPPGMLERQQEEHAPFNQPRTLETDYVVHGRTKTLLLNVVPVQLHDRTVLYGIGHDITKWKQAQKALERRNAQMNALREVGLDITAQLELDTVLHSIVARAIELLGATEGGLYLYRPERELLEWVVAFGPHIAQVGSTLKKGEGLSGKVWESGRPLIVDDYAKWDGRAKIYDHYPFAATVGVPIYGTSSTFLGVLNVLAEPPRTFSADDAELLNLFATQAAIAIQNARLFESERQQREFTEALEEAAAVVNSTLDLDQVLDRILDQVARILPGDGFGITAVENDAVRTLRWRNPTGLTTPADHVVTFDDFPELREMAETGTSRVITDATSTLTEAAPKKWKWLRSYVSAPIRIADAAVGFLHIVSRQPNHFSPADARRLEIFAAHVATAIENAQLHQRLLDHAEELEQHVHARTTELKAQYARMEAILDNATDGILVTDAKGNVLQANPVAQAWLGGTLSKPDTQRLQQTIRAMARFVSTTGERLAKKAPKVTLELTGIDLELDAAPIAASGTPPTVVLDIHDITHLKSLERMKTQLITNLSHEMRTPIATVQSYAYLLSSTPPTDEKWPQYLQALIEETNRQARLGEDILQISHAYTGRLAVLPRPTSINSLLEAIINRHQLQVQEKSITLAVRYAEGLPDALADVEQLTRVFNYLMGDAVHYAQAGGCVEVSTALRESEGDLWVTASVSDTGEYISPADFPHIFERFLREEEPQARRVSESGLRLMVVKEIIRQHGGLITVDSPAPAPTAAAEPAGATFTIWLPLAGGRSKRDTPPSRPTTP